MPAIRTRLTSADPVRIPQAQYNLLAAFEEIMARAWRFGRIASADLVAYVDGVRH